jgi:hypothetical protein
MEKTQTAYDLNTIFTQESARDSDDKKIFFDENKLKIKTFISSTGEQYNIVQYQKEWINNDNVNTLGLFRSVIFNKDFQILSFSPPKSLKLETDNLNSDDISVEEFIEGTMINMFYDKRINDWEIATRSTIGGNVKFYYNSPDTFNTMFYSTFNEMGLNKNDLKKDHCYSFILQHKGNRIVVPIENNRIFLAESYKIDETMNVISSYDNELVSKYPLLKIEEINYTGIDDIRENYATSGKTNYTIMGAVFKNNSTGKRMKLRNPEYEAVRKLRGNQCKDQYNYLSLRKQGQVAIYLKHYPEDKKRFSTYRELVHKATHDLYKNYQDCYIYKKSELNTYPSEFKTHMYKLHHELYLMKLKPNKSSLQLFNVKEYVNNLHPSLLMHMINRNAKHVISE